ncbi:hypothetical protein R1flu_012584 [Riccia fluitans]|uniref:Uncharacterized protein n=1 Tax=Riccia fluitans TaxID=41844 RepID=A0ABD1ZB19_9MARC
MSSPNRLSVDLGENGRWVQEEKEDEAIDRQEGISWEDLNQTMEGMEEIVVDINDKVPFVEKEIDVGKMTNRLGRLKRTVIVMFAIEVALSMERVSAWIQEVLIR